MLNLKSSLLVFEKYEEHPEKTHIDKENESLGYTMQLTLKF